MEGDENWMNTICQLRAANSYDQMTHGTEVLEPEYDPQGNLLHDATRKYTWDADIHLTSVTTEGQGEGQRSEKGSETHQNGGLTPHNAVDEAPSRTTTSRFVYDALHRRVGRVKDDGEVTVFVYEGWNVIEERTVRGGGVREGGGLKLGSRYVWGEDLSGTLQGAGGIGGLLSSVQVGAAKGDEAEGTTSFFHYDSNGNVILLTDGRGRESARYAYDAFGKTLTATGPAARMNRYRFSTKPVEAESGLVYYGYRYYDPVTGRWPSRDPIGERGGVNLYGMVGNGMPYDVDVHGLVGMWPSFTPPGSGADDPSDPSNNPFVGESPCGQNLKKYECRACCAGFGIAASYACNHLAEPWKRNCNLLVASLVLACALGCETCED